MPIGMTPDQYFEAFVIGNYNDYVENKGSVRRAFNAALSASHMADHYFYYYKRHNPSKVNQFKEIKNLLSHLSDNTNKFFKDIRSIANAYKHLYTGQKKTYAKHSSVSSAGTIEEVKLTGGSVKNVSEDISKVVYTRKSGQKLEFFPALEVVVQYWDKGFFS